MWSAMHSMPFACAGTPPEVPSDVSEAIDFTVRRLAECLLTVRTYHALLLHCHNGIHVPQL